MQRNKKSKMLRVLGSNYNRNHLTHNTVEIMHSSAILSNGCHYQSKEQKWDENVLLPVRVPCSCFAFSLTTAYQPNIQLQIYFFFLFLRFCSFI